MSQPVSREGSLTFSLSELARLEAERLRDEAAHAARIQAARAAAETEARRLRLEEEAREARAREERDREEQRLAEQQAARLLAVTEAELLRAKSEAAVAARIQLEEQAHRHAEAIARSGVGVAARKWKLVAAVSWGLLLAGVAACLVIAFAFVRPEAARRVAVAERILDEQSAELRTAREQVREGERAAGELRAALDEQKGAREKLASDLEAARTEIARLKSPKISSGPRSAGPAHPAGPFSTDCPPDSRDPLCSLRR